VYRTAELGDEVGALEHAPAGCLVYVLAATSVAIGGLMVGAVGASAFTCDRFDSNVFFAGLAGLTFLVPGAGVFWSTWRRDRERTSFVLHELGCVRRSSRGVETFRWADVEKITLVRMPSSVDTFVLDMKSGERVEMSTANLRGITERTGELLTSLTTLAIETIPLRPSP
jgi:hypothetical protein